VLNEALLMKEEINIGWVFARKLVDFEDVVIMCGRANKCKIMLPQTMDYR
jgi:hypothetical protein